MKKLLNKLKQTWNSAMKFAKFALDFMIHYVMIVAAIMLVAVTVLKLPEIQGKYYRTAVGSKVYMIRDSFESGGGTGFAIKAPSGKSYILTNDHVCGVSSDKKTVLVTGEQGSLRRNIISHDLNSDLCLIEGMPGVEGLDTAGSAPEVGDHLNVVGHPRLMPTHVSTGEMIGTQDVSILYGYISVLNPETGKSEQIDPAKGGMLPEQCTGAKYSQQDIEMNIIFAVLKVKVCIMTVHDAYNTAITIHPGNSGSPVVNFWGNVVGVAFAGSSDTNWGMMVPLKDVKAFLKNY